MILDENTIQILLEKAREAKEQAYAPYSGYRVGACLLLPDGRMYTGCNVENAAYGDTICAERTAIVKAVSEGERRFCAIAITADGEGIAYPCGSCRQVLSEFGLDTLVIASNRQLQYHIQTVGSLLPHSFSCDAMEDSVLPEKESVVPEMQEKKICLG